jgi:hypothetical protein
MRTLIRCVSFVGVLSWATLGHGAPAEDGDAPVEDIGGPAGGGDDFGGTAPPGGASRPRAVDSALGTPSPGAEFTPDTNEGAGFVERGRSGTDDRVYGSTAKGTDPAGNQINGYQIYGEDLDPSDPGYADDVPEYHVVQQGDTLWGISGYYLHDPYSWPKLWSWNEHVTNAHWIFPGDRIRLQDPRRGGGGDRPGGPGYGFTRTKLPPGTRFGTYTLNQTAYVDKEQFETAMKVIGGAEANVLMATLDTVYMSYDPGRPPIPGERLIVYAPQRKVYDIKDKKVIGYIVQVMGEVEIDSIARKAVEGTVATSYNAIERGYRVGPLRRQYRKVDPVRAEKTAHGRVVATLNSSGPLHVKVSKRKGRAGDHVLVGEEQFVVVNMGRGTGVKVGNILEVVRKGDEYTKKRVFKIPYEDGWPRRVTAALLVVQVDAEASLAVAIYSRREVERGDHVELHGGRVKEGEGQGEGGEHGAFGPQGRVEVEWSEGRTEEQKERDAADQDADAKGEASVSKKGKKKKAKAKFEVGG